MTPWIKMRVNLEDDPRVQCAVGILSRDKRDTISTHHVLGALYALWALADQHTIDGRLVGYTAALIDARMSLPGFCAAFADPSVGWVEIGDNFVRVVDFGKHNGRSGKARAVNTARQRSLRDTRRKTVAPLARLKRDQNESKRKNTSSLSTEKKGAACAAVLWSDWQKHLPAEMRGQDVHDACKRWTKHRIEIKHPLKPTMVEAQAKLLASWGPVRAVAAIDHTIAMGWQGLREPDLPRPANGHPTPKTPAERRREEQDRAIEEIGR